MKAVSPSNPSRPGLRPTDLLRRVLGVYPSEQAALLRLSGLFFLVFFLLALFRNHVETSFLKRYGPDQLPLMLLLGGLLTALFFHLCRRLAARFPHGTVLAAFLGGLGLLQAGMFLAVREGITAAYPALYLLLTLKDAVLLVFVWNLAQAAFDVRQGRRLFRLLTAVQVLGATLGSLAAGPLAHFLGFDLILPVCGGANLALAGMLLRQGRGTPDAPPAPGAAPDGLAGFLADFRQRPIFRYLCTGTVLSTLVLPFLTYEFGVVANAAFPDEPTLLHFLSLFRAATTLTSFLFILGLGAVCARLSPPAAALVAPVNQVLAFAGLALGFNLAAAGYAQFSTILVQRTVQGPTAKVLFSLLPRDILGRTQVLVRGVMTQTGAILGAFLLLGLKPVLSPREIALAALVPALAWTVEAVLFRRKYGAGLKQVLVADMLDHDRLEEAASGRAVLPGTGEASLAPENYPEGVLTLLEQLDIPHIPADQALADLAHPDQSRREQAAASCVLTRDFRTVNPLLGLLEDTESVRRAAVDALARFGPAVLPALELALSRGSARVQEGILEILRLGGFEDFDLEPSTAARLVSAYSMLMAGEALQALPDTPSRARLSLALREKQQQDLGLIFSALWVRHADMRLLHEAVARGDAPAAVEMLEASLDPRMAEALVPLLDSIPRAEKIARGRKALFLPRLDGPERVLAHLARGEDPVIRVCALAVIAEQEQPLPFVPAVQWSLNDPDPQAQAAARWCLRRCQGEEAPMPSFIERIDVLRRFPVFSGLGIWELRAIGSVASVAAFTAGEDVVRQGDALEGLYLVAKGGLTLLGNAQGQGAASIAEEGFFGELELFTGQPAAQTCRADRDSELLVIGQAHFLEIMKLYPLIGVNLCRFLAGRLQAGGKPPPARSGEIGPPPPTPGCPDAG